MGKLDTTTDRSKIGNKRLRRRVFILLSIGIVLVWTLHKAFEQTLFPRERILTYPVETKTVSRRYVLFTAPVQSGEWPTLYSTKDKLTSAAPESAKSINTQVYTGLPRRTTQSQSVQAHEFVVAMAVNVTQVMADNFYAKAYMAGADTTLLLGIDSTDTQEHRALERYLEKFAVNSVVTSIDAASVEERKFKLLGAMDTLRANRTEAAKYYTIINPDIFLPSLSTFQNLLAQYNSVESHLIVDESFKTPATSYGPVTLTNTLMDRVFQGSFWEKCLKAAEAETTGMSMISQCIALSQGLTSSLAKYDGESLVLREVEGSTLGLLEAGHQPLAYRPDRIHAPAAMSDAAFQELISGRGAVNSSELFGRYSFWEDDMVKWVYTHGTSMAHYPRGISDKELKMTEVTWKRTPEEPLAHDAPYYRALAAPEIKTNYFLQLVKPYSVLIKDAGRKKQLEWVAMVYRSSVGEDIQVDWVTSP